MDSQRSLLTSLLSACLVSTLALALLFIRYMRLSSPQYFFLTWNLFLAGLPLVFAILAYLNRHGGIRFALALALWLLFFPNAPYLITDLMHIQHSAVAIMWFDTLMIFAFVLAGILLGFLSLALMQRIVEGKWGQITGWLFALAALLTGSFGVYVGRFLRWNSWDVFVSPLGLLRDVTGIILNPGEEIHFVGAALLLNVILTLAYVALFPPDLSRLEGYWRIGQGREKIAS